MVPIITPPPPHDAASGPTSVINMHGDVEEGSGGNGDDISDSGDKLKIIFDNECVGKTVSEGERP
jgi:hypothetical protein